MIGNARVELPGQLAIEAEELVVSQGGKVLRSRGSEVAFTVFGDAALQGTARKLYADVERGAVSLSGGVDLASPPGAATPVLLRAGRVVLTREERLVRADQEVDASIGRGRLTARRIAIYFAQGRDVVEYVHARWAVVAEWPYLDELGHENVLTVRGRMLSLLVDPPTRLLRRIEVEGTETRGAAFSAASETGDLTQVSSTHLQAELVDGVLAELLALGRAELQQGAVAAPGRPWRVACASRIAADFGPGGEILRLRLDELVDLHEPGLQAAGDEARVDLAAETAEMTGPEVWVLSERGEIRAPTVRWSGQSGILAAEGGVQTLLPAEEAGALKATALGGKGPISVVADSASWQRRSGDFEFSGSVRAWSGDDLLLAEQLRGDFAGQQLAASGGVETKWRRPADSGGLGSVTVTSRLLSYSQDAGRLLYEGDVRVLEADRVLSCEELEMVLRPAEEGGDSGGAGEPERMVCSRSVELDEAATARKVTADRAEYDLEARTVLFSGDPVTLKDGAGGQVEGATLLYHLGDGRVQVGGPAPEASENP